MIALLIVDTVLIAMAVAVVSGKGDNLIAGYNTASTEERARVNIKRLRRVVSGVLLLAAAFISLPILCGADDDVVAHLCSALAVVAVAIVGVILANTWCVNK